MTKDKYISVRDIRIYLNYHIQDKFNLIYVMIHLYFYINIPGNYLGGGVISIFFFPKISVRKRWKIIFMDMQNNQKYLMKLNK